MTNTARTFTLAMAAAVATTGIAALAPLQAAAGVTQLTTTRVVTNTPDLCPNLPTGAPVRTRVLTVTTTTNGYVAVHNTTTRVFCF